MWRSCAPIRNKLKNYLGVLAAAVTPARSEQVVVSHG